MKTFQELFDEHTGRGIIKWSHYPAIYDKHFWQYRDKEITVLEIGVQRGGSLEIWEKYFPKAKIYGIDLSSSGYYNSTVKDKYKDRLIPIQGNSHYVADLVPQVDLVFIDADHSYNGCFGDIVAYKPKVRSGGILSGHDIDYPGVNSAVSKLIKNYEVGPNNVWFTKV